MGGVCPRGSDCLVGFSNPWASNPTSAVCCAPRWGVPACWRALILLGKSTGLLLRLIRQEEARIGNAQDAACLKSLEPVLQSGVVSAVVCLLLPHPSDDQWLLGDSEVKEVRPWLRALGAALRCSFYLNSQQSLSKYLYWSLSPFWTSLVAPQ